MVVSKAPLAAKTVWGQGECLLCEVVEVPFLCLTHNWMPHLVRGGDDRQPAFKDSSMMHVRLDSGERTKPPSPMQMDSIARVEGPSSWRSRRPVTTSSSILRSAPSVLSRSCRPNIRILPQGSGLVARRRGRKLEISPLSAARLAGFCPDVAGPSGGEAESDRPRSGLHSERGKYVGFMKLLRSRHIVLFGTCLGEGITAFSVWKKGRRWTLAWAGRREGRLPLPGNAKFSLKVL